MLKTAYTAAMTSKHKFQHSCVVFRKNKPVAIDVNINFGHAEIRALDKIRAEDRATCTVFSLRFSRAGKLQNAKPCQNCQKYMRTHGLRFVYYSTSLGTIRKMIL